MGKNPAWGVLNTFLSHASELPVPKVASAAASEPRDCTPAACSHADAARESADQRLREASWSATSVTAEARHIVRMTRSAEADADDPTSVVRADTATHRADAGAAWGILIHGLFEHAMGHEAATRDDLRRLAMWLTVEEPQLRAVIDEAIDTVERAAKADFWQRARSHEHLVEAPFVVGDGTRLTSGVIDLLYSADSGWQVVDYKTDVELHEDAYAAQLNTYRVAAAWLRGGEGGRRGYQIDAFVKGCVADGMLEELRGRSNCSVHQGQRIGPR